MIGGGIRRQRAPRTTLAGITVAVAAAGAVLAQINGCRDAPTAIPRVAFINSGPQAPNAMNVAAFRAGLADLGYVEGRNIAVDFRWGDGKVERLPALVNELLKLKPDVIVSTGGPPTIAALKAATTSVPVVFITGDPVAEKIVPNLARPGGNLTGLAVLSGDLEAKRLEILKTVLPSVKRVAVVVNPNQPAIGGIMLSVRAAAARLNLSLQVFEARDPGELEQMLARIDIAKFDALFIVADPVLGFARQRIVDFAGRNRLPGVYFWREFAEDGGLMSYGTNLPATYRRAAVYVDKILKGARPGDLPVEQPTTFEFVINRNTAKALGITIPPPVLVGAEVIPRD